MKTEILDHHGPLPAEKLAAAVARLGVSLPDDYRGFMLRYNGGRPEPDTFDIHWREDQECGEDWRTSCVSWFLSVTDEAAANFLKYNLQTFAGRIPRNTFAVAYDPGGNLILLAAAEPYAGRVLFWVKDYEVDEDEEPGYDNVGIVADSFDDFLNNKLR